MAGEMISVRLEINNWKVREEIEKILSSMGGFHLQDADPSGACDLLILEIGEDHKEEFKRIHFLQASGVVGSIFLTSPRMEPQVLIECLRAGAKEFFSQPIKGEEVRNALLKFKGGRTNTPSRVQAKKGGQIIQVIGSKGGIGVTTLAVNLAVSLAQMNTSRSVALVDMNLLFGEVPLFLDLKSSFDWGEVVKNISRVDSTFLRSILCKHPSGVSVLTSPIGLGRMNQPTPEILEKLLAAMQETFDFIIIDGGQSIDDLSLKIMEMANQVLLVASLSLPCLTNVKRLLWTLQQLGYHWQEKIKIVISRYQKHSLISLKQAEQSINHKIFWQIPNDFQTTMAAINQGKPLFQVGNGAEICKNLRELAASFMGKEAKDREKESLWHKIVR